MKNLPSISYKRNTLRSCKKKKKKSVFLVNLEQIETRLSLSNYLHGKLPWENNFGIVLDIHL